jgi:hypothetical protein
LHTVEAEADTHTELEITVTKVQWEQVFKIVTAEVQAEVAEQVEIGSVAQQAAEAAHEVVDNLL